MSPCNVQRWKTISKTKSTKQFDEYIYIYIYVCACVCVCVCVCACVWGGGGGNEDPKSNLNGQSRLFLRMHLESRGRSLVM